ncbi:MAG TPA: ATP-binding cassette domain-containing protein, partial [Casimicrobiaceae bacterium]|nr:ATP-binding cassette domain-containing protein [Casimicrobiaceae bacterium]
MIRISNLTLARGNKRLLEGANLTVHVGHKVGIVGANGCGKSSLFAAIRGELLPDAGSIDLPPRWTLAHVAQETPAVAAPAIEYVQDGDRELRDIEQALAAAGAAHAHAQGSGGAIEAERGEGRGAVSDGTRLAELHHRFDAIGGYSARARAATLLAGLGFDEQAQARPVESFSGGWRMRLNLAQALMCRSDLLLLDEPTNHLDLDAVLWLEDWLRRYPGTLLLVTHDRDFLDAVADTIVHVDAGRLTAYTGNYAQFERERAQQLALQQAAYAKQQRQVAHLKAYIDRFRAKATKARQAQSRIKALERMELIAAAHVDSPFAFSFPPVETAARQLLRLEHASLGYPGVAPVLEGVDWAILAGARIGLLGANGAGKSTLLKSLAGTLPLVSGERFAAQGLRLGYFAQHQVEQLRPGESALWHLRRLEPDTREQELRDYLGGFDFRGDMATASVGRFSGGEKARLALALIVRQRPNLLLLDEPTNHLDIEMREALTEALQDYGGALIVVAHDRHLLRATADELWLLADGRLSPFDGDLDDYKAWVLGRERRAGRRPDDAVEPAKAPADRRSRKREEALARQKRSDQRKPLVARQAVLERDMESLGAERKLLDAWLASPDAYTE